jgi:hypothetical protein
MPGSEKAMIQCPEYQRKYITRMIKNLLLNIIQERKPGGIKQLGFFSFTAA